MSVRSELKTLYHLLARPMRGKDHATRMENFYRGQADTYDDFRDRMLHGRRELYSSIPAPPGGTWVDLGGGTARSLEFVGPNLAQLNRVYVVDVSQAMLEVGRQRAARCKWTNVEFVHADAIHFRPPEGLADVVTLSYSLTMIPDWRAAIATAAAILKPGGTVGVVDFYVSSNTPDPGLTRHGWLTRLLWPAWFGRGGLIISSEQVSVLRSHFDSVDFREIMGKIPYVLFPLAPFYRFVGRTRG